MVQFYSHIEITVFLVPAYNGENMWMCLDGSANGVSTELDLTALSIENPNMEVIAAHITQ